MSRTRPQRFSFHNSIIYRRRSLSPSFTTMTRWLTSSVADFMYARALLVAAFSSYFELYLSGHKSNLSPRHASVNWLTSHIIPFKQYFSLRQCNLTWISRVTLVVVAVHRLNLKLLRALHSPLCLARNKPPPPMMMTEIKTLCRCVCSRLTGTAEW